MAYPWGRWLGSGRTTDILLVVLLALAVLAVAGCANTQQAIDDFRATNEKANLAIAEIRVTLATIAEIQAIRGRDPGAALRRLRDMGLVRVTGRRRAVGRPFTYGTTDKFLELFGLRDLEELPAPEEFRELLEA